MLLDDTHGAHPVAGLRHPLHVSNAAQKGPEMAARDGLIFDHDGAQWVGPVHVGTAKRARNPLPTGPASSMADEP